MTGKSGNEADIEAKCDILEFKPPRLNPFVFSIARLVYPLILAVKYGKFSAQVVSGLESVAALGTNRVILCPNHPSVMDTETVFTTATLLREPLYFLTAREVFRGTFANRHFLQLLGCFSVLRGSNDFNSFNQSTNILDKGAHKLLVFPEGEIAGRNDMLLPLKPGPAHIACTAVDRLRKRGSSDSVFVVPIALRYTYPSLPAHFLVESMIAIENALGIQGSQDESLQKRIKRAGEIVLNEMALKHNCQDCGQGPFYARVEAVRRAILKEIAAYIAYEPPENIDEVELAHRLYVHLYKARWYEEQLEQTLDFASHHDRYRLLNELIHDLHRVVNFISVSKPSPLENQDDLVNSLMLLKREVLPKQKWRLPIRLLVAFATPIQIDTYYDGKKPHKMQSIISITEKMKEEMAALLEILMQLPTADA